MQTRINAAADDAMRHTPWPKAIAAADLGARCLDVARAQLSDQARGAAHIPVWSVDDMPSHVALPAPEYLPRWRRAEDARAVIGPWVTTHGVRPLALLRDPATARTVALVPMPRISGTWGVWSVPVTETAERAPSSWWDAYAARMMRELARYEHCLPEVMQSSARSPAPLDRPAWIDDVANPNQRRALEDWHDRRTGKYATTFLWHYDADQVSRQYADYWDALRNFAAKRGSPDVAQAVDRLQTASSVYSRAMPDDEAYAERPALLTMQAGESLAHALLATMSDYTHNFDAAASLVGRLVRLQFDALDLPPPPGNDEPRAHAELLSAAAHPLGAIGLEGYGQLPIAQSFGAAFMYWVPPNGIPHALCLWLLTRDPNDDALSFAKSHLLTSYTHATMSAGWIVRFASQIAEPKAWHLGRALHGRILVGDATTATRCIAAGQTFLHPRHQLYGTDAAHYECLEPVESARALWLPGAHEVLAPLHGAMLPVAGCYESMPAARVMRGDIPRKHRATNATTGRSVTYDLGPDGLVWGEVRWHDSVRLAVSPTRMEEKKVAPRDGSTDMRNALRRVHWSWLLDVVARPFGMRVPRVVNIWNKGYPRSIRWSEICNGTDPRLGPDDRQKDVSAQLEMLYRDNSRCAELAAVSDHSPLLPHILQRLAPEWAHEKSPADYVHWLMVTIGEQLALLTFFHVDHGTDRRIIDAASSVATVHRSPMLHSGNVSVAGEICDFETARWQRDRTRLLARYIHADNGYVISAANVAAAERAFRTPSADAPKNSLSEWIGVLCGLAPDVELSRVLRTGFERKLAWLDAQKIDVVGLVKQFHAEQWSPWIRQQRDNIAYRINY